MAPRLPRRRLSIGMLFPNMITILSLCCGMSAIRYALDERWELSVSLIIISIILDGMDGRLARLLKATSDFGAQLDSLADFLSFGVAPAIVTYLWMMNEIKGVGWAVGMFFAVCAALRLARFNTALPEDKSSKPELF
ncbi:MAG: CDP-alcohol phosphatidyltransferase family protein, partial [Alphaproteobacteria bacterium]|nr:CDP-alcohol phosphatidyltransferase family protein [Alphaproteobacteria bacterium]